MNKKQIKGFTLVELLIVIAIIGIISTISVIALGNARVKSRDAKRVADLKQISTALELYYDDNGSYPEIITPGQSLSSPDNSRVYMSQIPTNPTPKNDGDCSNGDYIYTPRDSSKKYSISGCLGSTGGPYNPGIASQSPVGFFSCGNEVTDRDGYKYRTIEIGTQCWMAENLKTKTKPGGQALSNSVFGNKIVGSERTCPAEACSTDAGTEADCDTYGALYTWTGAMAGETTANSQGICPDGWHIPSDNDWNTMEQYLTDFNEERTCDSTRNGAWDCSFAGDKLKLEADCAFPEYNHCGNETTFNAPMAGGRDTDGETFCTASIYNTRGNYEMFWTSSQPNNTDECSWCSPVESFAWDRSLAANTERTQRMGLQIEYAFSVRCIKD